MIRFPKTPAVYQREPADCTVSFWRLCRIAADGEPWHYPRRLTEHYVLLLPTVGSVRAQVGERQYRIGENEILTVDFGQIFTMEPAEAGRCELYMLEFNCSDFPFYELKNGCFAAGGIPGIGERFAQLQQTLRAADTDPVVRDAYLLLILHDIRRRTRVPLKKQQLYDRICEYLSRHVREDVSAETLGAALGYHPDYLNRVVRECAGFPLRQLIIREKIAAAKTLLITTDCTVARIAELLSFPSANQFLKYFKYHTGMTPSRYRKRKT